MKNFYTANKLQIKYNNVITALEYLYPNHLASKFSINTKHFEAWKYISAISSMKLTEFSVQGFLEVLKNFEKTYGVIKKAEVLSCSYSSTEELISFCKENKYGILTENDFFYFKNNILISLNGNEISGEVILVEQVK